MNAPQLKPYELPILAGLARGHTAAEIADHTATPYATVKNRIMRMRQRLGAPNTAALVDLGYRYGWLTRLRPEPRPHVWLSGQQRAALCCIAAGMTNDQVARALGVAQGTALEHVRRLYAALDTGDRAHAVALAHQHGHLRTDVHAIAA